MQRRTTATTPTTLGRRWCRVGTVAAGAATADAAAQPQQPARPRPRRLILLRHAASEEAGRARNDHDRPVSDKGREEARAVAERLAGLGWRPDLIVGSNSRRTVQTLDAMAQADAAAFGSADTHLLGSLYTVSATDGATRQALAEVIVRVCSPDGVGGGAAGGLGGVGAGGAGVVATVMAVGHNRGWEEAASSFARATVRLETATAALLEHVGGVGAGSGGSGGGGGGDGGAPSWAEALAGEWRLVQVVSPSSP